MERRIILRGGLAGALGGLLAFLFARVFAEPVIGRAIDYESGRDAAQEALDKGAAMPASMPGMPGMEGMADPGGGGVELFTRTVQSNIGIGVGMIAFGLSMGLLFAVLYCVLAGRFTRLTATSLSVLLAGAMFLTLYVVPFLKYPANPPAVGYGETIKDRTGLYLLMVVVSVAALVFAVWVASRLQSKLGLWSATLLGGAVFIGVVGVVMLVLPSLGQLSANASYGHFRTETPQPLRDATGAIVYPGFPADDLFYFRLYAVAAQIILWTTIVVIFTPMARRLLDSPQQSAGLAQRV